MSGICGAVYWDRQPVDIGLLRAMAEAAAHRGPDGVRWRTTGRAAFAHLALHTTPESTRDEQPLSTPDGQHLLVADARIDNREELTATLRAKDIPTGRDPTDAELILAGYRCWGTDCAAHFIGDFAFAIWDARLRRLFAARDPMAMRAFYYRTEPRRFLFGTEVKQILAAPEIPARIFEPAVAAYLAGCFDHLDWTFYEGIAQLPPAHALVVDETGSRRWRYWEVDPEYRIEYKDTEQYAEHFLELFREAVRCRVRSVKAVGILLSGGMDSGAVASTAGRLFEQDRLCPEFRTYSWAFDGLKKCDERHVSDIIVRHCRFPVTYVDAEAHAPLEHYPEHGPDRDEPFTGVYQPLLECSMMRARDESVGVLLSGDRGDLVAGEYIYDYPGLFGSGQWTTLLRELALRARWRNASLASAVWKHLIGPCPEIFWPPATAPRLRRELGRAFRRLRGWQPTYPPWIRPEFARRVNLDEIVRDGPMALHLSGMARRRRHAVIFMPMYSSGMVWSERTQARFGLGFADAWGDRRLAEFAIAVPQRVLNRTGEDKRLVRHAMSGIMPEEARRAARKIVPLPLYIRALTETARETVSDLLRSSTSGALGYVDEAELRRHHERVLETRRDSSCFWWALTTEMWLRRYWA